MMKIHFTTLLTIVATCSCAILVYDIFRNSFFNDNINLTDDENKVDNVDVVSKESKESKNKENVEKMEFGIVRVHHMIESVRVLQYDMMQPISEEAEKIECVVMKNTSTNPSHYICLNVKDWFSDNIKKNLNYWEYGIQNFIKSFFDRNPDAMFLDLGMNIGLMSMFVAASSNENVQILGVEPSPKCVVAVHKATHLNKFQNRFTVVIAAISNKRSEVSMTGEFAMMKINRKVKENEANVFKTSAITLNDLTPLMKRKKALMKIDIEGSECHAFANAEKLFDVIDIPIVVIEIGLTKNEGSCCFEAMLKFLSDRNYQGHYFPDHVGHEIPLDNSKWQQWDFGVNIYFQRK